MIVLALVLLIIVLLFSAAIVLSNPDVYQLSLFRILVPVTSAGVFFTGFGAALVTITALLLLRTGIRRSRETRRRLRSADRAIDSSAGSTGDVAAADPDTGPATGRSDDPDIARRRDGDLDDRRADEKEPRNSAAARPEAQPASSLDLEPGEDSTTSPGDQQRTRDGLDRDEPRI